ncbi:uncharacterized protein LOC135714635 [Ochlerotatus camptorhynchus]|uniref:uncharacterized protein LOC135714635 n=1 Tax=Ochlerotatus camptorhynchus TaxID=644619 RepID=UPI0031D1F905
METRRKRELELVNRLKVLQAQYDEETKRMQGSEEGLRTQLESRGRQLSALQDTIKYLENQHVEELQRIRQSEEDLRIQLEHRNREQATIQRQNAELESEIQRLRATEQQLQSQLVVTCQREQEAIRLRSKAEKDYWALRDEVQQLEDVVQTRNEGQSSTFGPSSQQLAARQVVTKELPIFSGDPVDWPLFISSYQHSSEICGYSNAENLLRLQRSLRSSAKDAVSSFLLHPSTVPQILSTLQQLYGRPEQIVNNMIAKVRATPAPRTDRLETLVSFGLVVQNLCGHLKAVGLERHLSNPILLQELVDKLPATAKFSWALYQEQVPVVDLNVFSGYMAKVSSAASGVTQLVSIPPKAGREERSKPKEKSFINAHMATETEQSKHREEPTRTRNWEKAAEETQQPKYSSTRSKFCPVCKVDGHQIGNCAAFKRLDLDGRWKSVKANKLCARCLTSHARWPCKGEVCGINECPKRHHRLLHFEPPVESKSDEASTSAVVTVHRQITSSTLFRILPVTLFGQRGQVNTYAFLDDGSSVTLVERSIAEELGAEGRVESLYLQWTGGVNKKISGSEVVNMEISEAGGNKRFKVSDVYTVDNLGLPQQTLDFEELSSSLGVAVVPAVKGVEEQRAYKILEETTRRTSTGKYETGLLWKYDYIEFPDSRPMAERRFKCLEKRLARNPNLYDSVCRQIADFKSKSYIHEATMQELEGFDLRRTWFLPIGVVLNEKKPGKVRVIWDAASKVEGISLNSMLLIGPDLLTPLFSVMFPYRERQVAVSTDVKEMFLQMLIREQDRSALLFPYRDSPELPMSIMVSDVAIFGAACSPAHSQYIKNLNASDQEWELPRGAAAVTKRHYVDDYVDSFNTAEEAYEVAKEVIEVHRRAGFHIRNWMSSDKSVLEKLGEPNREPSKIMLPDKEVGYERVLGMVWLQEEDVFAFSLQFCERIRTLVEAPAIPTKREMLRVVVSMYDPLGLVASFVVHGKILIQDVWRTDTEWDGKVPEVIVKRWMEWLVVLKEMDGLRIPRCYFLEYDADSFKSLELHIFVDASAQAFAAVGYFRIVDKGHIRVALVSSKTKVAPLRGLSIPRLELMTALLGARLRRTIDRNHTLKIHKTFFWSDSSTVCSWIKSDVRRYRQFVAFRVDEILSLSSVDEWRWISTKVNVADEATKWGKGPSCNVDSRWFQGPEFLYAQEAGWSMDPNEEGNMDESDKELRAAVVCSHLVVQPVVDAERFSKFERLLHCMAYMYHFINNLRTPSTELADTVGMTSEELQMAEGILWQTAQSEAFAEEITILKQRRGDQRALGKQLDPSSAIMKLTPFADEYGVLRVGSRAAAAQILSYDAKFPIILPRNHRITDLLLDYYHRKYGHANGETVVNEVRQKFHVPKLRVQLRLIKKRCMLCHVYKATPVMPKMGPLPSVRLEPFVRPFTYVGVDIFGPYLIRIGRSAVKRWVCLFTCLTVRAIHLEVVASLSTDSCKKVIRRFIARRGSPQEIYSDNGTNFVGANRDLVDEVKKINIELSSTFTNTETQWRFNPPSAPHMGGCWERMVRAVKSALGSIPAVRKLDEESLATVLAEAESMVNSRPLTYIPLETADHESLTPNHFLMLSSNGVREPEKTPTDDGMALRNSWNMVQHTLDNFWRRWIVEYLPTITRRTKWFRDVRPIKEGELVFVADENVRNRWMRGRVVQVIPGKDGVVRRAEVLTSRGILKRPAAKLAVLDVENSGDAKPEAMATRGGGCSPQQPLVSVTSSGS